MIILYSLMWGRRESRGDKGEIEGSNKKCIRVGKRESERERDRKKEREKSQLPIVCKEGVG